MKRVLVNAVGGTAPTNGAAVEIAMGEPYIATVSLRGTADMLFHRWNCEKIEEKANTKKGSKAKKTDDVESYVYRNDDGELSLPGEYVRQSIVHAAKFRQDPRSPRKSAMDLYKAAVQSLTPLAAIYRPESHGAPIKVWDYEHKCRVTIQRSGITRVRPAVKAGWRKCNCSSCYPSTFRPTTSKTFSRRPASWSGSVIFAPPTADSRSPASRSDSTNSLLPQPNP